MTKLSSFILSILLALTVVACSDQTEPAAEADAGTEAMHAESHPPSSGAEDMPGAAGTFEFKPTDFQEGQETWWIDTDGVNPEVAGCHIGTNEAGEPNGRMFGEACLDNGLLVESNPGVEELHSHKNDTGHPDTFDCNAFCIGKGKTSGVCQVADSPPCAQSAICACS